jgi:hypothetical protein
MSATIIECDQFVVRGRDRIHMIDPGFRELGHARPIAIAREDLNLAGCRIVMVEENPTILSERRLAQNRLRTGEDLGISTRICTHDGWRRSSSA